MIRMSAAYRSFSVANYIFLAVLSILCILPLWNVAAISLSAKSAAESGLVGLWPIHFNLNAYQKTFSNTVFAEAIWVTLQRVALGVLLTMTIMTMAAYALSKEYSYFKGRTTLTWFFVVTILFNGGLIPSYILISKLHLINSLWALILPNIMNVFNMILMINFFRTVPKELEESSLLDGAGHFTTLFRIYVPVSMPSIATIALFTIVFHWNSWFDGLIYMTDPHHYPLGTLLQSLIQSKDLSRIIADSRVLKEFSPRTLSGAQIFIGTLPVIFGYVLLQKYFIKGIVLGSVKG